MPRNGSGTMTAAETYTTGQTITAAVINSNITDIATELTNSVAKDGQTVMTGPLKASNGTAAAPSITFGSDLDTGLYRKSSNKIAVALGGVEMPGAFTPTGAMLQYLGTTAPSGWVRGNGRTIGNASSSATERANADTEDLFSFLWDNFADAQCAVSSGRGASAAVDYAANKTITLPDLRGRSFFGLDDMGATAASRLGTVITSQTTNGASGGTETVALTSAQLAAHTHDLGNHTHAVTGNTGSHTHSFSATTSSDTVTYTDTIRSGINNAADAPNAFSANIGETTASRSSSAHSHTVSGTSGGNTASISLTSAVPSSNTSGSSGSGDAHSNMPPAWLGTFIIKL